MLGSEREGCGTRAPCACRSTRRARSPARSRGGRRADGRRRLEQQPAEVAQARARRSPRPRTCRVDPDLLELHRRRRPGGGLRLEQDTPSSSQSHERPSSICAACASGSRRGRAQRVDPELLVRRGAGGHEQVEVVRRRRAQARLARLAAARRARRPAGPGRSSRGSGQRRRAASQSSPTARCLADDHPRRRCAAASAKTAQPLPEGTMFAPTWQSALSAPSVAATAEKRPSPRRATSSRKTRSTGSSAQNASTWSSVGATVCHMRNVSYRRSYRVRPMPIHVRAEPGEYAEAVLLPGDPLRAKYIAETYSTTSSSGTPSAACSATRAPGRASRSRCRERAWAARARRSSSRSSCSSAARS